MSYFERYIDDLKEGGRLEPESEDVYEEWNNSGLGVHNRGTDEFKLLERYLAERRAGVSQDKDAGRIEEAIRAAGEGRFEDLFQFVRTDEPRLSARPVLLDVDVEMLAELFTSDQRDLFAGARFLAYRYSKIDEHSPIAIELPWARRVVEAIERRVEKWSAPHRQLGLTNFRTIIRQYEGKRDVNLRLRPEDNTKGEAALA